MTNIWRKIRKISYDTTVQLTTKYFFLDDRDSVPSGNGFFFHQVQADSGAHPASYPMCTQDKADEVSPPAFM
jgi:hypothetical protein